MGNEIFLQAQRTFYARHPLLQADFETSLRRQFDHDHMHAPSSRAKNLFGQNLAVRIHRLETFAQDSRLDLLIETQLDLNPIALPTRLNTTLDPQRRTLQ